MDIQTQRKMDEIKELLRQKDEIEGKIKELLNPQPKMAFPSDFSLNGEVLSIIQGKPDGISKDTILREIQQKYPDYGINRKRLSSALAYLKNTKDQIHNPRLGFYVLTTGIEETDFDLSLSERGGQES